MRQFLQMSIAEVQMAFKSFFATYVLFAPMVILIILRFFLPSVESTSVTVAVVDEGPLAVEEELIRELELYADVQRFATLDEVERKLRGTGEAEGLYRDPETGQYVSLLERNVDANEFFSTGARAVRQYTLGRDVPGAPRLVEFSAGVPDELSDRTANSPVATMGGAVFLAALTILTGFLIGLSVVRDKELGTDRAIRVSPVTRTEYYLAKSTFPVLVMLAYTIIGLTVLGLLNVSILQTYVIAVVSVAVTLLFGLLIGALAHNETEALGLVKSIGTVLLLGVLGGALLPENWQWIVYWVPLYWIFDAAQGVFMLTATWTDVVWRSGVMLGISLAAFLVLQRRIARGLS